MINNQQQIKHEELQQAMKNLDSVIQSWNYDMTKREKEFQELKEVSTKYQFGEGEIIKLNIGGKKFNVMKETLSQKIIRIDYDSEEDGEDEEKKYYPPHLFSALVSGMHNLTKDESDYIFIDR
ncbi:predicted protein [Naegleria gruberi]|uniref:Predicted protein n=1 Tax=Naegleria gruberi TaxID=5762 RepID=D2W1W9_NAEGR|nr:uncharacterized protein NAEGRDRAFT_75297 [Naegleria gruberi]EFC36937.1 predicted protein [Naegleria gruberi]|eukprot:XP_002669681.1 predicted protein [Naegleria gruberi strain NEG-M]